MGGKGVQEREGEREGEKGFGKNKFRRVCMKKYIAIICSENLKVIYTLYNSSNPYYPWGNRSSFFLESEILAITENNWEFSFNLNQQWLYSLSLLNSTDFVLSRE